MATIPSVYGLISRYRETHPDGHFFDRKTLKFFGERISEMRVLKKTEKVTSYGTEHECFVLSSLQRNHPSGSKRVYHYFDVDTLDDVIV